MTYEADEISQRGSAPIELYQFTLGQSETRLTNAGQAQTYASQVYLPAPITRSSPTFSPEKVGSELQVDIALGDENARAILDAFVDRPPPGLSRIALFRAQPSGSASFWSGFIVTASYDQQRLSLLCRPFSDIISKTAPRRGFGVLCQHVLYDDRCSVVEADFAQVGTVTAISPDRIDVTVSGLSAPAVRWDGGTISRTGGLQRALILSESAGVFTLRYPWREVSVGDNVELAEGCRHDLTDCQAFANAENYGGFPYTPLGRNPFARGLDKV